MKRVLKTLAIHLFCILFFAIFYYYFSTHFEKNIQNKCNNNCNNSKNDSGLELITDFLLFSTTIQAGVGINELSPISILGKAMMIIQQLIMISINVLTIYVFTM
jgi:hypothetical protein